MSRRIQFILNNPHLTNGEICKELGISPEFLDAIKAQNGLEGYNLTRGRWEKQDELYLKFNYHNVPTKKLAKRLNRSVMAIQKKAFAMGITRKYGSV